MTDVVPNARAPLHLPGSIRSLREAAALALASGLLALASPSAPAGADDGGDAPPSSLARVRQLLLAGQTDEAAELLDRLAARGAAGGEVDPVELDVLAGLVQQQRGRHREAVWTFRHVLDDHPERTSVHLFLGQSLYALGDLQAAHDALSAGEGAGRRLAGYFALRAAVERDLGRPHDAYRTLDEGLTLFPGNPALLGQQALVLIGLGLVEAAREPARSLLDARPDDVGSYLLLAEALRQARRVDEAIVVLEEAALRFPDDPDVLSRLAYCYALADLPLTSARLYTRAHAARPDYAFEIAEQLRVGGRFREALSFNAALDDEERKLPQRLAIHLGMGRPDLAAALAPLLLSRPWLDDATRYQLAYACAVTGDVETVDLLAESIADPALRSAAEALRAAVGSPPP